MASSSREGLVYVAKLAEQAERYDGLLTHFSFASVLLCPALYYGGGDEECRTAKCGADGRGEKPALGR
ncbi:hypothetical protein CRG98_016742, partial [Punica granatum]